MNQLIVKLIIVTLVASQQIVLFSTSFTDKKFTSLENWSLYPQSPLKTGYGSLTSDDDDYAGLYSIIGVSMRSYLNGMYKIFENIPPHSSLIIKAKTLIQNYGLGGLGIIHIRIDGKLVTRFQSEFDLDNNQKIYSSEIFFISSSSSVIIEFHFEGVGYYKDMTFGFREFHLYYRKCPDGCLYCQTLDSNQNHCNFWFQNHHSLHDSNSLNDGWAIIRNDQTLYKMEYCRDDKALNLIGIILPTEAFEKTLYLEPHHKILIQYKQLLLGADFFSAAYWSLELNDVTVKEIPFFTYHRTSYLCKHHNPSSLGDYITQVIYEDFHQNTIVKLRIFTQGRIFFQKLKWTIRDFEVYIQKCHPDCTESCFGPRANQCLRQKYPEFQNFISYFTEPLFTDTQEWQMITPIQPKSPNYCNGVSIFGGFLQLGGDHYIQRIITLEDHQTIQISFKFYQIDNFNNDILYVVVDDQIVYQTVLEPIIDTTKATPLCGIYENYDLIVKISTPIIQHTQKKSIIQIYTNQPTTSQGYWGIRDIIIKQDSIIYIQELKQVRFLINDWINFAWIITQKVQTIEICKNKNYIISNNILGQPSKFRKIIKNLPLHSKIRIQFIIILTYTTITEDIIQINYTLDQNENQITKNLQLINDQYCETATLSKAYNFDDFIDHSNNNLFLILSIDSISINWGIRDFQLSYSDS